MTLREIARRLRVHKKQGTDAEIGPSGFWIASVLVAGRTVETIIEMGVTVMENFSGLILAFVFVWISYCFWTGIYGAIIITGVLGWRKFKRQGFLLILLSGCIRLLHHLPSIYCKGVYAMRRLTPAEYGEAAMIWVYIDSIVVPIASLLLVIGLLFLVFKGPLEFADPDERGY